MTSAPRLRKAIAEQDIPERGWLKTGVFLSAEQLAVVNEAKRNETVHYLDADGRPTHSITKSYLFHVRKFAQAAGLPSSLMIFDCDDDGEILISRWRLPSEKGVVIDQ